MTLDVLIAFIPAIFFFLVLWVITAGLAKAFEGKLSFRQAWSTAGLSFVPSFLLLVPYWVLKPILAIPNALDAISMLGVMVLSAALMTRRVRAFGIEKVGWLGLGGKVVLSLIAVSWVMVGITFLFMNIKLG